MKKILATLAIAFMLLLPGGTGVVNAANCPPAASYDEMFISLDKNNEQIYIANDKYIRFFEKFVGLPANMVISQMIFVILKDGQGLMQIAFIDNCLVPESVVHIPLQDFLNFLAANGFSPEDFVKTEGA